MVHLKVLKMLALVDTETAKDANMKGMRFNAKK
jgi:hypothetical protein